MFEAAFIMIEIIKCNFKIGSLHTNSKLIFNDNLFSPTIKREGFCTHIFNVITKKKIQKRSVIGLFKCQGTPKIGDDVHLLPLEKRSDILYGDVTGCKIGICGLSAGRGRYCATPVVSRDLSIYDLVRRSCLLPPASGPWGLILPESQRDDFSIE